MTGVDSVLSTVTDGSTSLTSTRQRGSKRSPSYASRLRRSVSSSTAPSMKSKTARGRRGEPRAAVVDVEDHRSLASPSARST